MTGNNAVGAGYMNSAGGISFSASGNSPTSAAFPMLGNLNSVYGGSSNVMIAGNGNRGVSRNQSTEELAASDQNLSSVGGGNLSAAVGGVGSSNTRKASSQLSLSPRSSLSSVSPPVSPYDPTLPSYEQAYLSSQERQRRLNLHLATTATPGNLLPGATGQQQSNNVYQQMESPVDSESGKRLLVSSTSSLNVSSSSVNAAGLSPLKRSLGALAGGGANMKPYHRDLDLTDLTSAILSNNNNNIPPPLLSSPSSITAGSSLSSSIYSSSIGSQRRTTGQESVSSDQSAPLSPISESAILSDSSSSNSRLNPASRSVSAAVSDESVAGDSGVFEAASSSTSRKDDLGLAMNLETAQIQIKLRYSTPDGLLHIGKF
jgi:protein KIBRA